MSDNVIAWRPREVDTPLCPPRLTFARMCIWCGVRDCTDSNCVELHDVSVWAVCGHCHGTGEGFKAGPKGCTCAFGLALVAPVIERRRCVSEGPRPLYTIDEGHWSAFNHNAYGGPVADELRVVAGDRRAVVA